MESEAVPVAEFTVNFSPMPRTAPPPVGSDNAGRSEPAPPGADSPGAAALPEPPPLALAAPAGVCWTPALPGDPILPEDAALPEGAVPAEELSCFFPVAMVLLLSFSLG